MIPTNCQHARTIYVRLDLSATKKGGKGQATVDLSDALAGDPAGTTVGIVGAALAASMSNAANCPTGNGPADIAGRVDDPDCDPGALVYALFGIVRP